MSDTTLPMTDMGPFMRRHDLRSRRIFIALLTASLLFSGGTFLYGVRTLGSPAALPGPLWFAMLFYPFPIAILMVGRLAMSRRRRLQADASLPMDPIDARSTVRVANAGAVYAVGLSAIMLLSQIASVLKVFHAQPLLDGVGEWFTWRAVPVVTGILLAWFGNAWPLVPTPRGSHPAVAVIKNFNRYLGWILVLHGLLFMVAGMLLPRNPPIYAIGIGGTGASMMLCVAVWGVSFHRAMKMARAT